MCGNTNIRRLDLKVSAAIETEDRVSSCSCNNWTKTKLTSWSNSLDEYRISHHMMNVCQNIRAKLPRKFDVFLTFNLGDHPPETGQFLSVHRTSYRQKERDYDRDMPK